MIFTKCVMCGRGCVIPEEKEEETHPDKTLYWSYEDDKQIRPYCGAKCSLDDYQKRIENE